MRFLLVGLSGPSLSMLCLKDPQKGDDTISGTSDGQDDRFERVLATQRKEKSLR